MTQSTEAEGRNPVDLWVPTPEQSKLKVAEVITTEHRSGIFLKDIAQVKEAISIPWRMLIQDTEATLQQSGYAWLYGDEVPFGMEREFDIETRKDGDGFVLKIKVEGFSGGGRPKYQFSEESIAEELGAPRALVDREVQVFFAKHQLEIGGYGFVVDFGEVIEKARSAVSDLTFTNPNNETLEELAKRPQIAVLLGLKDEVAVSMSLGPRLDSYPSQYGYVNNHIKGSMLFGQYRPDYKGNMLPSVSFSIHQSHPERSTRKVPTFDENVAVNVQDLSNRISHAFTPQAA